MNQDTVTNPFWSCTRNNACWNMEDATKYFTEVENTMLNHSPRLHPNALGSTASSTYCN